MKRTSQTFKKGYNEETGKETVTEGEKEQAEQVYKQWQDTAKEKGLAPLSTNQVDETELPPDFNQVRRFFHETPLRKRRGLTDDMMFLRTDDGQIVAISDSDEPMSGLSLKTKGGDSLSSINRNFSLVNFDDRGQPTLYPLFTTDVMSKPLKDLDQKWLSIDDVTALSPLFNSLDPETNELVRDMYTQGEDGKYAVKSIYQGMMGQPIWNFTHVLKQPGTLDIPKIGEHNIVPPDKRRNTNFREMMARRRKE